MADELDGMATFVAVAEAKGFRAAADRLRVSHSAVSQALRRLEERVGVALVRRTTRSVHLTEAGERLYASVRPALDEVRAAVAAVGELGESPRGTLRLHLTTGAEAYFNGPLLAGFLATHPHVRLDLAVSETPVDIVADGYDAGARLGEVIDKDMIAVPVSGDIRLVVVAAPSYFERHPVPKHPRELVEHDCLAWHPTPDAPPYRWEFTETGPKGGRGFSVAVPGRVITTDPAMNARLARAGAGVTMIREDRVRDDLVSGALVEVLAEFCAPFPGYYLYYPQRRHASPALRALVDCLRRARRSERGA
ncbi:MAG: LysR family transcriptional regulator [Gemmatimonadaceae bacterium]|nr:LysR family transcriptional regulator [Gemmatimonadaceae bacterium]NUQ94063.1 LysR family transcriptional regulator [Gemmatimonadaceae bacterium]NUR21092.1 LysR family transcriptional regulator [Gemmatimonadaceae bacterium]NUS97247.1 LysR family transcriptional regulator [Gemmatimonadaceae bacterium]